LQVRGQYRCIDWLGDSRALLCFFRPGDLERYRSSRHEHGKHDAHQAQQSASGHRLLSVIAGKLTNVGSLPCGGFFLQVTLPRMFLL
jgi:hypothetical protein